GLSGEAWRGLSGGAWRGRCGAARRGLYGAWGRGGGGGGAIAAAPAAGAPTRRHDAVPLSLPVVDGRGAGGAAAHHLRGDLLRPRSADLPARAPAPRAALGPRARRRGARRDRPDPAALAGDAALRHAGHRLAGVDLAGPARR